VVSGIAQKNSTSPIHPWISQKATKGLAVLTPKMNCDQTAMSLPPVTSAVGIPHSEVILV
jgi:hypothetical protein